MLFCQKLYLIEFEFATYNQAKKFQMNKFEIHI